MPHQAQDYTQATYVYHTKMVLISSPLPRRGKEPVVYADCLMHLLSMDHWPAGRVSKGSPLDGQAEHSGAANSEFCFLSSLSFEANSGEHSCYRNVLSYRRAQLLQCASFSHCSTTNLTHLARILCGRQTTVHTECPAALTELTHSMIVTKRSHAIRCPIEERLNNSASLYMHCNCE